MFEAAAAAEARCERLERLYHSSAEQWEADRQDLQRGLGEARQVREGLETRLEGARDNQTAALFNYNLARIDLAQAMGKVRSLVQ